MNWRLALLYYVSKLGDLLQITEIEQSKFCICYSGRDSKMVQATSKYFCFFLYKCGTESVNEEISSFFAFNCLNYIYTLVTTI